MLEISVLLRVFSLYLRELTSLNRGLIGYRMISHDISYTRAFPKKTWVNWKLTAENGDWINNNWGCHAKLCHDGNSKMLPCWGTYPDVINQDKSKINQVSFPTSEIQPVDSVSSRSHPRLLGDVLVARHSAVAPQCPPPVGLPRWTTRHSYPVALTIKPQKKSWVYHLVI